ncbi:hypothetical protein TGAM01_v203351 [Trichoderma gamsii]|uniref:Uncharacterized protein n=1 Tax=Trichoderma gamsii TaxID=398673 RepID=A0A2P4ZTF5_9HYPO|nr:hypothetical protein TGAM01_v203351 [Trichoderma gamsii]PON27584.1 hypothetical protein TGAM01_v203351 [Trichoderma gamsii]
MDFAPYQSSPPEHTRSPMSSPRASADIARRPFSPSAIASVARSPPPLQHPQPQRAWSGDLDGAASRHGSNNGGLWGLGSGNSSANGTPLAMPGAYPAEISEFDTSLGLRLDYEASLAYLAFPPIGAVILLILERNSDYVRFHAWQSALLFTAIMVFHLLFSWSSFLSWIFFIGDLVLMGFLALKAYQDAEILERYTRKPFFLNHQR